MKKIPLLIFLFVYQPAHATISYVSSAENAVESAGGVATGVDVVLATTAGCTIFATATSSFNGAPLAANMLATPTDTQGNVYTRATYYYGYNPIFSVSGTWLTHNCVGGANTVHFTGSAAYGFNAVVVQLSGSSITIDQHGVWPCGSTAADGTANVLSTPPLFTSVATEMLLAWGYTKDQLVTLAANNSFTIRAQGGSLPLSYSGTLAVATRSVSSRGTYLTTFSGATAGKFNYSGAISLSEGGSVITPAIQQLGCGDSNEPWHEMGTFFSGDILLAEQKAGDYIFVSYRHRDDTGVPSTISNTNGYSWTSIALTNKWALWYAIVPMNAAAGDLITFGNISYDNAGRVVELHGLGSLPSLVTSANTSAIMNLVLSGYTTPNYCTSSANDCATTSQWNGTMVDTRALLGDFLIFAQAEAGWAYSPPAIPGTTPPPGTVGTDLFPTDHNFSGVWLPGAPLGVKHATQEY